MVVPGAQSDCMVLKRGYLKNLYSVRCFFSFILNDIVEYMGSVIHLFADDISLYLVVDNPIDTASVINSDLNKINFWAKMACYL